MTVVPFKIYADFESGLKRVQKTNRDVNASYSEKYQEHISRIKSCALMIDLANQLFFTEEKIVQKFIAEILNEYVYCRGE